MGNPIGWRSEGVSLIAVSITLEAYAAIWATLA